MDVAGGGVPGYPQAKSWQDVAKHCALANLIGALFALFLPWVRLGSFSFTFTANSNRGFSPQVFQETQPWHYPTLPLRHLVWDDGEWSWVRGG